MNRKSPANFRRAKSFYLGVKHLPFTPSVFACGESTSLQERGFSVPLCPTCRHKKTRPPIYAVWQVSRLLFRGRLRDFFCLVLSEEKNTAPGNRCCVLLFIYIVLVAPICHCISAWQQVRRFQSARKPPRQRGQPHRS